MLEHREVEKNASAAPGKTWDDAINDAYGELQQDPKVSQEAKTALSDSQNKWNDYKNADIEFFDNVFAKDPHNSGTLYKDAILQDRAEQLQALKDGKLTAADNTSPIDRRLRRCLGMSQNSGDSFVCLVDAANNWQILKNQTLDSLVTTWKPEMRQKLSNEEKAWQDFATTEDHFLSTYYPNEGGPEDAGTKRIKAEINAVKDRALELLTIQHMAHKQGGIEQ